MSRARSTATLQRRRPVAPPIARAIAEGEIHAVYQPLVDLGSGDVVGYEALARGPAGSGLERPDRMFEAASRAGVRAELEWECLRAALRGALEAGLGGEQALFINLEPSLLSHARPADLRALLEAALERFPVFVEFTERALTRAPADLLATVERLRSLGAGVALDDVGVDPTSLALMPFLAPDVIKLDLSLVQGPPSLEKAAVMHAVNAESERAGALILGEGVEHELHRKTAISLGAGYAQGWLFGRPGPISQASHAPLSRPIGVRRAPPLAPGGSPFEVVAASRPILRGDKGLLLALSLQIEGHTAALGSAAVLLSSFQDDRYFTAATARRYASLAQDASLVVALGRGLSEEPAPRVRGVSLDRDDPICKEWDVIVLDPHFSMAFVARDLGDAGEDSARRFDYALTYDRALVLDAARALMGRVLVT